MVDAHLYDFTVTRFGVPEPYRHRSLNSAMEFGEVIRVLPGRMIVAPDDSNRANWAPEVVIALDDEGQVMAGAEQEMLDEVRADGWDLMFGYSGQQGGRHGAIMHASEFVGGGIADDILDTPGVYVVLEVTGLYPSEEAEENDSDDPIGWVVAYSQT